MLSQAPVAAVLPAMDIARAKKFWTEQVGLSLKMDDQGMFVLEAGAGTVLVIYDRQDPKRGGNTQVSFMVKDIEAEVEQLRSRGVKFEDYDMPGLKTVNGIASHGDQKSAWFIDTEGNIIAVNSMP